MFIYDAPDSRDDYRAPNESNSQLVCFSLYIWITQLTLTFSSAAGSTSQPGRTVKTRGVQVSADNPDNPVAFPSSCPVHAGMHHLVEGGGQKLTELCGSELLT